MNANFADECCEVVAAGGMLKRPETDRELLTSVPAAKSQNQQEFDIA